MSKQVTITLGGKQYSIKEKPMGQNSAWRKKLRESRVMRLFESLDGVVSQIMSLIEEVALGKKIADLDMAKTIGVARFLPTIVDGLANSIDEIVELLFDYDAKLQAERKWIEANAYDAEAVAAFVEVLKLTFPITGVLDLIGGFKAPPTVTNSPDLNGASNGLSASGPSRKASTSSSTLTSAAKGGKRENRQQQP